MKISLIYHVYRNTNTLEESLNSIVNQQDKNFDLILINDGAINKVNNILKQYNFSSICNSFKYILYSQNQGHSISFNEASKQCDSDYVYYLGSNIILQPNFIKTINKVIESKANADVISFTHVIKKNKLLVNEFNSLESDLQYKVTPSLRDKVFSLSFLKQKNIWLNESGYFPLEFVCKVLMNFKKWVLINSEIIKYFNNIYFTYNLYDIFQANALIIKNYSKTSFWKKNRNLIEFLMIIYSTRIFLLRIFLLYKEKDTRKGAMRFAENWLNTNIPKWKENPILLSKKVDLTGESKERIINIFKKKFYKKILDKN